MTDKQQPAPERVTLTPFADGFICDAPHPSVAASAATGTPIIYVRQRVPDEKQLARGYWPTLVDRADGVKGHFCIGRLIRPNESYWEFWNSGRWLSAGQVFIGEDVATAALDRLRASMLQQPAASDATRMRWRGGDNYQADKEIKHSETCSVWLPLDRTCDCGAIRIKGENE